jgi:hypothetical protein
MTMPIDRKHSSEAGAELSAIQTVRVLLYVFVLSRVRTQNRLPLLLDTL